LLEKAGLFLVIWRWMLALNKPENKKRYMSRANKDFLIGLPYLDQQS